MTTPERALELADMLNDEIAGWRIVASRQSLSAEHEKSMRRATDAAAILRRYAEIMQSEVVAVMPVFPYGSGSPDLYFAAASKTELAGLIDESYDSSDYEVVELIIKPAP